MARDGRRRASNQNSEMALGPSSIPRCMEGQRQLIANTVGIDKADEAVTVGLRNGVIGQAGAWYTLPNGARFNGKEALVEGVREDPDSIVEIRRLVLEANEQNILVDEISETTLGEAQSE